jgi:hypothetical protein
LDEFYEEKPSSVIDYLLLKDLPAFFTPQYNLRYPAWNFKLKKVIKNFIESYKKTGRMWCIQASPKDFISNHSSIIEYIPKIFSLEGKKYTLTIHEGVEFAIEFIEWTRKYYIWS